MAQHTSPLRSTKPKTQSNQTGGTQNTRHPLQGAAAEKSGKSRSRSGTAGSGTTVEFDAMRKPNAATGLGKFRSVKSEQSREALVQEMSRTAYPDRDTLKKHLSVLVQENKALSGEETPQKLHLHMGFDDCEGGETHESAAKLADELCGTASTLSRHLDDPECKLMLKWITDAWRDHGSIHRKAANDAKRAEKVETGTAAEGKAKHMSTTLADEVSYSTVSLDERSVQDGAGKAPHRTSPSSKTRSPGTSIYEGSHVDLDTSSMSTEAKKSRHHRSASADTRSLGTSVFEGSHVDLETSSVSAEKGKTPPRSSKPITVSSHPHTESSASLVKRGQNRARKHDDSEFLQGEESSEANPDGLKLTRPSQPKVQRKGSYGTFMSKADGAAVLKQAALRDELLAAVKAGNENALDAAMQKIPATVKYLDVYFPHEVPELSNQNMSKRLKTLKILSPRYNELKAYVKQVERRAQGRIKAESMLMRAPEMMAIVARVHDLCIALRDTPESQLQVQAKWIEMQMQAILRGSKTGATLVSAFAYQPLVSMSTLLKKCAVLEGHVDSATLDDVFKLCADARRKQEQSGEKLLEALIQTDIKRPLNSDAQIKMLKQRSKFNLAHALTSGLTNFVVDGATEHHQFEHARKVIRNITKLPPSDRNFITQYELEALIDIESRLTAMLG